MSQKKISLIVFVVSLFFTTCSFGQSDFRKASWGMNASAVKTTETAMLVTEDATRIIYQSNLAKIRGKVIYTFTTSDKLLRAKYLLKPDYTNNNFFIRDYKMFQDLLTEKYGKQLEQNVNKINNQSISEREWATNLNSNLFRIETKWANSKTEILLTLTKIGNQPTIQIDYISKELSALDLKEKKEKILKHL